MRFKQGVDLKLRSTSWPSQAFLTMKSHLSFCHIFSRCGCLDVRLVHTLHTPSGHEHAAFAAPGPLGSRDAWREQFRSALMLGRRGLDDNNWAT